MENKNKKIRILYYGAGWPTNIGNAFLDLGAIWSLRQAAPDALISFASEMPRWFFSRGGRTSPKNRTFIRTKDYSENALDIAAVTECDLVVFAGMSMCREFISVNGPSIEALSERGVPVFLLGTGAAEYTAEEKKVFEKFLSQIRVAGFLSRDDDSYNMFAESVKVAQKGIDCGFFVSDAYSAPSLHMQPYVVSAFDNSLEVMLDLQGRLLVRAHHVCKFPISEEYIKKGPTLISDIPHDYLALYANAREVHSDRVHACVAALAYGNRAKLYHSTPRGKLFEAVGADTIRLKLTSIDMSLLTERKKRQIDFIQKIIEDIKKS